MNWKRNAATLAACCLMLDAGAAFAQGDPTPTKPDPTQPTHPTQGEKRNDDKHGEMEGRVRRVSKLLDCSVKNTKGEKIGKVEALIIDRDEGRVAYAVLSFGGFLGIGEKYFAMPFSRIVRTDDDTCVVADLTKSQLDAAPAFTSDAWPTFDRKYGETIHDYYKATPYWNESAGEGNADPARVSKDALGKDRLNSHGMCRASKVIGTDVEDAAGKNLGDIDDVIIDDGNGRIVYAVLSFGGFLGMGDKLFALPWKSLTRSAKDEDKFVLDISKDRLQAAPGFDKKHWPDLADHRFGLDIYKYYGQQPYWNASKDKSDPAPANR